MDDFDCLEGTVENIDNNLRKNNISLKGAREGVEGKDVKQFSEEIFTAYLGSECEVVAQIELAFHVGAIRQPLSHPRDIVVKLPSWHLKSKLLEAFWEQGGLEIAEASVSVFPDLS